MANSGSLSKKPEEPVRLVFVGSPMLDIRVSGSDPVAYGLKPDDCVPATTDEHHRLFQELLLSENPKLEAGGSALISAKLAKWVLEERGHVSFAGCVGSDDFSLKLNQALQSSGVEPLLISQPDQPTAVCACLLSADGLRSMVTRLGAAAFFSTDHLEAGTIRKRLREAHCIFVVGYFAGHSPEVVRTLADSCSPSQVFSLSLSSEYICREYTSVLLDVLPRVDILLANEAEVRAFAEAATNQKSLTTEDAVLIVARLRSSDYRSRILLVTRGPDPVILVRGNNPPRHILVPHPLKVVDSVGCGDALAGAFLATYALTADEDRAIEVGIQAAVRIAQVHGCEPLFERFHI